MSHFGMLFSQRQSGSHNIFRPAETSTMTCRDLSFAGLLGNCALLKSSRHRVTNMTLGWEENLDVLMIPVTSYSAIKKLCIVRVSSELGRPQVARSWNRRSLWCSGTTVNKQARVKLELKLHSLLKDTDWVNTIIWSRQDHHSIKITQCLHLNIEPEPMNQWYEKENSIRTALTSLKITTWTRCMRKNILEFSASFFKIIQDYSTKPQSWILNTGNKYFDFETISIIHLPYMVKNCIIH